jgi:uncharacterized protein YqiB (DUF1249 family)
VLVQPVLSADLDQTRVEASIELRVVEQLRLTFLLTIEISRLPSEVSSQWDAQPSCYVRLGPSARGRSGGRTAA